MLDAIGRNVGVMAVSCAIAASMLPAFAFLAVVIREGATAVPAAAPASLYILFSSNLFVWAFGFALLPILWLARRFGLAAKALCAALAPVFVTLLVTPSDTFFSDTMFALSNASGTSMPVAAAAVLYFILTAFLSDVNHEHH